MEWLVRHLNPLTRLAPLRLWALIGGGPVLTAAAVALVMIVWQGDWPIELAARRLDYIGWSLLIVLSLIAVIIVTLAAVRVKASGPAGTGLEIDADSKTGASE